MYKKNNQWAVIPYQLSADKSSHIPFHESTRHVQHKICICLQKILKIDNVTTNVLHKLIHILYYVCILVIWVILLFFYPLYLYVFVLICQYYVVLLERTNKDIYIYIMKVRYTYYINHLYIYIIYHLFPLFHYR